MHTVKVVKLANFYWAAISCQASTLKSFFPKVFLLSTAFGRQNVIETDILENKKQLPAIQYILLTMRYGFLAHQRNKYEWMEKHLKQADLLTIVVSL